MISIAGPTNTQKDGVESHDFCTNEFAKCTRRSYTFSWLGLSQAVGCRGPLCGVMSARHGVSGRKDVKKKWNDSKEEFPGSNPCGQGGEKDALYWWGSLGGSFLNACGRTASVGLSFVLFEACAGIWRLCCPNLSSLSMSVLNKPAAQGAYTKSFDDFSLSNIVAFSFRAADE
eukprot:1139844-Pelagomonas_calceolata.AAC.4